MSTKTFTISDTSPAAASTAAGTIITGLEDFDFLRIDAALVGATGGTLNVHLQRQVKANVWADWLSFTQLAAGAAAVKYTTNCSGAAATTTISTSFGIGTDASPGVALAAGTFLGGHPGRAIRAVYVAGASTSAGAAVLIYITGYRSQK